METVLQQFGLTRESVMAMTINCRPENYHEPVTEEKLIEPGQTTDTIIRGQVRTKFSIRPNAHDR